MISPAIDLPATDTATCTRCKKTFTYEPAMLWGRRLGLPPAICDRCDAQVEQERRDADAARVQQARRAAWLKVCPPLYRDTDLDRLPPIRPDVVEKVITWQMGPRGLVLHGPTGTGKTRLVWKLLERLHHHQGIKFRYFGPSDFGHQVKRALWRSPIEGEKWVQGVVNAPLVVFDDLGKSNLSEQEQAELFHVVNTRAEWCRPIIVTGNSTGDTMKGMFSGDRGEPIIRRLREFCDCLSVMVNPLR